MVIALIVGGALFVVLALFLLATGFYEMFTKQSGASDVRFASLMILIGLVMLGVGIWQVETAILQ